MRSIPGVKPPSLHQESNNASVDYLSRKIVDVIKQEIPAGVLGTDNFNNAMWIAMQTVCGPQRAAMTVSRCQIAN